MRKALITGITGQDGSHLAELLLSKGYQVHGMVRRASIDRHDRIGHLLGQVRLHEGDLLDSLARAVVRETFKISKTGTLNAENDHGPLGYSWFVGYAPADHPTTTALSPARTHAACTARRGSSGTSADTASRRRPPRTCSRPPT